MLRFPILLFLLWGLTACVSQPSYTRHGPQQDTSAPLNASDVNYRLDDQIFTHTVGCVMIFPTAHTDHALGNSVSRALARHAGEKIEKVVFPRHIQHVEQRNHLDHQVPSDQKRLADHFQCPYALHAEIYDQGEDFIGVAARKYIGLKVTLVSLEQTNRPLWQAIHTVWRGGGSVPISPLAALGGVANAALFSQDQDIMPDLIDRALRRIMRTMPQLS